MPRGVRPGGTSRIPRLRSVASNFRLSYDTFYRRFYSLFASRRVGMPKCCVHGGGEGVCLIFFAITSEEALDPLRGRSTKVLGFFVDIRGVCSRTRSQMSIVMSADPGTVRNRP